MISDWRRNQRFHDREGCGAAVVSVAEKAYATGKKGHILRRAEGCNVLELRQDMASAMPIGRCFEKGASAPEVFANGAVPGGETGGLANGNRSLAVAARIDRSD